MILSFLLVDEISLAGTHLNHFLQKNFVSEFHSRHCFVGFAIYFDSSCSVHGNVGIAIIHASGSEESGESDDEENLGIDGMSSLDHVKLSISSQCFIPD
ncbi:hypothetical protein D5086_033913 [Populus alba]|uniref:Uncharacterized protein n=1 Tax=Populus alba TaxID=43335 RepID=A0ACC4AJ18_POPAL